MASKPAVLARVKPQARAPLMDAVINAPTMGVARGSADRGSVRRPHQVQTAREKAFGIPHQLDPLQRVPPR